MGSRIAIATSWLVFGLAASGAATTEAFAADTACGPLKMITKIDLTATEGNVYTMPVTLEGKPENMLLDTGGMYSTLTPATVDDLKLKASKTPLNMYGAYGNQGEGVATVGKFGIGGMTGGDIPFAIMQEPLPANAVGVMALNHLRQFDMDLDFGARTLTFFSPAHCKGHVTYWTGPTGVVPLSLRNQHAHIDVKLDGVSLRAIIDTGATTSIVFKNKASFYLGVDEHSPDSKVAETQVLKSRSGEIIKRDIYSHTFKSLAFEGVTVANPPALLMSQVGADENDMVIGMDVLSKLNLYFAFDEGTLYVSPASPQDAASSGK